MSVAPPDVHALVMLLQQEIELVRYEMGKPRRLERGARITGVAPREVYFQALTLFRKANRLSFEHTGETVDALPRPDGEIEPADVLAVVENALNQIRRVEDTLGISADDWQSIMDGADHTAIDADPLDGITVINGNVTINGGTGTGLHDRRCSPGQGHRKAGLRCTGLADSVHTTLVYR